MTDLRTNRLVIEPLVVPASVDADDAAGFIEMVRLGNLFCRHDAGHDHFEERPSEALPGWQDQSDTTRMGWLARRDEGYVGAATLSLANEEGARTAEFDLFTYPDPWTSDAEDALVDVAEREAVSRGRSILQTWTLHRGDSLAGDAEVLPAPTGFGGVPRDDPQTRFFLRRGYSFEQTERNSVFDLAGSFEVVDRLLEEGFAAAGDDYRVVSWTAPTPPEHRDGFAYVLSRMATDAPSGDMVFDEESWDAARVERRDARMQRAGMTVSVAAVVHEPTGRIVAFNELVIGADPTGSTHQFGTLVITEHRGRRLGAIVKCANLRRWRELVPTSPRVSTFNAEENRPMLDINEELGFVPASYAGAWKRVLTEGG